MSTQVLIPEKIKPGLQVQVNWYGDRRVYYHGKIVRKLRKNWLVDIEEFNLGRSLASVPPSRLRLDASFARDGRLLMDNKEDTQYGLSKEHVDYFNSMTMETK